MSRGKLQYLAIMKRKKCKEKNKTTIKWANQLLLITLQNLITEEIKILYILSKNKIIKVHKSKVLGFEKCPVYLRLPWIGKVGVRFAQNISTIVRQCYFSSWPMYKNGLQIFWTSSVLYQFKCQCEAWWHR